MPVYPHTSDEAREYGARGGRASAESRRRRKQFREILAELLTLQVSDDELREHLEQQGIPPTNDVAIALAAVRRAQHGDVEAARFVRDTLGERPSTSIELSASERDIRALDLSTLTDEQLAKLAWGIEHRGALPG